MAITAILAKYGIMAVMAVISMLSIWYAGKTKGEANAKVKAAEQRTADQEELKVSEIQKTEAAAAAEVKAVGNANEQVVEVNAMSDADVINELHRDWSDPPNRN